MDARFVLPNMVNVGLSCIDDLGGLSCATIHGVDSTVRADAADAAWLLRPQADEMSFAAWPPPGSWHPHRSLARPCSLRLPLPRNFPLSMSIIISCPPLFSLKIAIASRRQRLNGRPKRLSMRWTLKTSQPPFSLFRCLECGSGTCKLPAACHGCATSTPRVLPGTTADVLVCSLSCPFPILKVACTR